MIKCVYFYSCLCRFAGVLVMLLPLFSLQWWRCQLIPSSCHSARILKNTKGQPNMLLPFSLKLLMTRVRCRDSLKDHIEVSQCISLLSQPGILESLYIVRCCNPCPFPLNFQFLPVYASLPEKSMWGKGGFDEVLQNQWISILIEIGGLQLVQKYMQLYTRCLVWEFQCRKTRLSKMDTSIKTSQNHKRSAAPCLTYTPCLEVYKGKELMEELAWVTYTPCSGLVHQSIGPKPFSIDRIERRESN